MIISDKWKDYEILDMANGEKLERWGNIILISGRLSMREDKDVTIVCETIEPNPKNILKDEIKPDVVHLHNLHSNYIHIPTLFSFLAATVPFRGE